MKVYLDFDGTCVEHKYPNIGRCNFGCIEVIKKLQDAGHEVILNTYRANLSKEKLEGALKWINQNYWMVLKDRSAENIDNFTLKQITALPKKKHPAPWYLEMIEETEEIYIDDIAFNIPLKKAVMSEGMMVDWDRVELDLISIGVL